MTQVGSMVAGRETVLVTHDATVLEAARRMAQHNIGAMPVIDGRRVVGVFSERDLMVRVVAAGRDPASTRVAEAMTRDLVVASPFDACEACLQLMKSAGVRHLLLLHEGRLEGIVSLRDLLLVDADEKALTLTLLNAYVHDIPVNFSPGR
jgi:CBS domain-containing protein